MRITSRLTLAAVAVWLLAAGVGSCGPGRGFGQRQRARKMTPLVFKQHIPNVAEEMLGASGPGEGRIERGDERFQGLVRVTRGDVLFKDDENGGDNRMMTLRCRDKLLALSVSVLNQWPGVRIRVIEGWDGDGHHLPDSLHYEGRAVDLTTSDRDRTKYGILARMAVDVGFDWVYYESRGHIHCSVKSDSSIATKFDGCFSGLSQVKVEGHSISIPMRDLRIGDRVLSLDVSTGALRYDDVIAFLHRSRDELATFRRLEADNDVTIDVTPSHLLFSAATEGAWPKSTKAWPTSSVEAWPASEIIKGRYLFSANASTVSPVKVRSVGVVRDVGVYAPLTRTGTIVVDGVVASCYALFRSHDVAHVAMAPLRFAYYVSGLVAEARDEVTSSNSVHWYAELLLRVTQRFVPAMFHGQGCEVY